MKLKQLTARFIEPPVIRRFVSKELADYFKKNVHPYPLVFEKVEAINAAWLKNNPERSETLEAATRERHLAFRAGSPEEYRILVQAAKAIGLKPYDYYNLSPLPAHATALIPEGKKAIDDCPLRIFASYANHDALKILLGAATYKQVSDVLATRQSFSKEFLNLLTEYRLRNGFTTEARAKEFAAAFVDTLCTKGQAQIDQALYNNIKAISPIAAAIVAFPPYANHITPRVCNIWELHKQLVESEVEMTPIVQGPPCSFPILLSQTSSRAKPVEITFVDGSKGQEQQEFVEIEFRNGALTPKGMQAYDSAMRKTLGEIDPDKITTNEAWDAYYDLLERNFKEAFPGAPDGQKDPEAFNRYLFENDLGYFTYNVNKENKPKEQKPYTLKELVACGALTLEPITFEGFLNFSAAGIFKSNGANGTVTHEFEDNPQALEKAFGGKILDSHNIYAAESAQSAKEAYRALGVQMPMVQTVRLEDALQKRGYELD